MSTARGRGGKFSKPKRGGGKHFSRDLQPLNADGEVMGMWGDQPKNSIDEESSEEDDEEESSEEESDDEGEQKEEMTREQRRAAAKARKQAAIARQNQKQAAPGDMPTDSEEEEEEDDDDMPANPNHTAKARSQAKAPTVASSSDAPDTKAKKDPSQLSRREREALQAQQAKERYNKLHAEGKTEEARADLERLKLVRERREAEAARKKAEAEERAEIEKEKKEQFEREERRRAAAMGKASRGGKGKKKA